MHKFSALHIECYFLFAVAGLESAHRCTKALYDKNPQETLALLSPDELSRLFADASYCELFLDPGTTLFDVVMKAKCFRQESRYICGIYVMFF